MFVDKAVHKIAYLQANSDFLGESVRREHGLNQWNGATGHCTAVRTNSVNFLTDT